MELFPVTALRSQAIFRIELCSGEIRRWRYLGADAQAHLWWRDMESGQEFNESSLMYAWRILDEESDRPMGSQESCQ